MFILTPSELLNPRSITVSSVPKRVLGRGLGVGIRGTVRRGVFWRLLIEHAFLRYMFALTPFPVAMLIWPELALPISQAPLLMLILIWLFETKVLAVSSERARRALISEAEAARGLDLLQLRARKVLTRIAARREVQGELLHLVVEQSELARVPPLTIVSVQVEGAELSLMKLTEADRADIVTGLFDETLDERVLQRINLSEKRFIRDTVLDPRTISAHARLAAMG